MITIKLNWNKKYTTIAVYAFIVIAVAVLFIVALIKFDSFASGLSFLSGILMPIVAGITIAYILNPLMMLFENKIFGRLKKKCTTQRRKTLLRTLTLTITIIIAIGLIVGFCFAMIPGLAQSMLDFVDKAPEYADKLEVLLMQTLDDNPFLKSIIADEFTQISTIVDSFVEWAKPMTNDIVSMVSSGVFGVMIGLKNVLLGFIISIYLLFSKEHLIAQSKKMMFAFMKYDHCKNLFLKCDYANSIFTKFIISNIIDSLIVGVATAIGMLVMGMPYPMLIAVFVGVTNLIPFFGPFIGAIPCGVLILLVDPIKVIWFALFILILQQLDGNVIKPLLFGDSVGLPAIWVLLSITIGGGLFGIAGMLLGVPVFAVIYAFFRNFVNNRLKKRDLPYETVVYEGKVAEFIEEHEPPEVGKKE